MVIIHPGSTKTLDTSLLMVESNTDIRDPSEIEYEVTSPPSEGTIIVNGIEASSFTQEDLIKGVVSYQHNKQGLKSKDAFSFTVQSKGVSDHGTFRIKIFKQGYLSEPEVIINKLIISYEGENAVINKDHLRVEQADILPSEMMYTIKQPPRLGHVVKVTNGSTLDYIHSFSQEEINNDQIFFMPMPTPGGDSFTVDITNRFVTLEDIQVAVDIVPGQVPFHGLNFTVREGSGVALTQDLLNITHSFYSSANIDFVVEEAPQHGAIRYMDGDEDDLTTFTWDEVKSGLIYYLHDSSETSEDCFTLLASAFEIGRTSEPVTIGITVLPVNDEPPRLTHNTGLEVLSGEDAEITEHMLSTEDADTPPEELVYSIETPSNGIVAFRVSPGDSIQNFTQAQINNGDVVFTHKGSQLGGFAFTVTDGEHTSPLYRFLVTARRITISMETEEELMLFPGTRQPITGDILKAVTSEGGDEITYAVLRAPRFGRLISPNHKKQFKEVSRFSQSELDSGSIFYEHQMPEEPFWVVMDSVELLLSSGPAQAMEHTLPVNVSFLAENRNGSSQLWRNTGLDIVRDQRKVIDSSRLDASNLLASIAESEQAFMDVMFEVKQFPAHGRLVLGDLDLPKESPYFLQEDLDNGDLEYLQRYSDASSDSFTFRVYLKPKVRGPQVQSPAAVVLEETFNISIRRRDYSPPELVSVDLLLEVLQGSAVVLTQEYLNTIDQDNTPAEIIFTVTKGPANGLLVDTESKDQIEKFTQEDINAGRVTFISDGSLADGFMEFTVSDGRHRTESHTLHIGILARALLLAKAEEIHVRQGDDETLITESMLKATTGGPNEEEVIYKITNIPEYAAVMVDRQPTSAFSQKQIREGRVSVRFVKSTSPRDTVAIVARSRAANISTILNVTVTPLVNLPYDPLLPQGATVLVDTKLLDASLLANKTNAVPTFHVVSQPKSAQFLKIGGAADGQPVMSFTQRDVEEGHVALQVPGDKVEEEEVKFILRAHGVPPAEGTLSFRTVPYDPSMTYGAKILKVPSSGSVVDRKDTAGRQSPPRTTPPGSRQRGNLGWSEGANPTTTHPDFGSHRKPVVSMQRNLWAILIPILAILLLLFLAAAVAYYLVRRNKTGKHNVQTTSPKPKNGEVKQETFRKTDPANNIPMSNVDSKEPDPELLQHCRTTNPALKKNQYWV
ncbi:hypothetical protein MATL_G00100640 [Megalops atlanticus]|uniref:Chondroitin sulfate proteoglycan 4 n=1 Tax=Megalops atlanticus TaxID=7932 RepID=A0A9D3Q2Q3_MEGAT|nr:hypothetical protein MATL_G00100640 [Megalops atlanticus]